MDKNQQPYIQTKDGKWVPAQPVPYYRDSRGFWLKIWHSLCTIRFSFIFDKKKRQAAEDEFEKTLDSYMVPVEPYTDENGKWHSM